MDVQLVIHTQKEVAHLIFHGNRWRHQLVYFYLDHEVRWSALTQVCHDATAKLSLQSDMYHVGR